MSTSTPHSQRLKKRGLGFTLVEVLVVTAIIGLLAGLIGPQILKQFGTAKSSTAKLQIEDIGAALDLFYLENGRYPTTDEGIDALITQPSQLNTWNGPYMKKAKVPVDPWGNAYHYKMPGDNWDYDLFSYGADNSSGGVKDNKDLVNWE